ncbi:MAG: hypothetical protein PHD01_04295 [Geobacteraceae bacterium]|nr:hypothetical protein [Geobacteraceae bacterium]
MKKMVSVVVVLTALAVLSGFAWASCEDDCDGPFQTCLNICRQTTKEDSSEAASCVNNCLHGVSGCVKRCEAANKRSENTGNTDCMIAAVFLENRGVNIVQGASCIDQGLTCVLHGTACCAPYECKGKFPNTTCQ